MSGGNFRQSASGLDNFVEHEKAARIEQWAACFFLHAYVADVGVVNVLARRGLVQPGIGAPS